MSCPASRRRRRHTHRRQRGDARLPLCQWVQSALKTDTLDELRPGRDRLELVDVAADALGSGQGEHAGVAKMSNPASILRVVG